MWVRITKEEQIKANKRFLYASIRGFSIAWLLIALATSLFHPWGERRTEVVATLDEFVSRLLFSLLVGVAIVLLTVIFHYVTGYRYNVMPKYYVCLHCGRQTEDLGNGVCKCGAELISSAGVKWKDQA